MGTGNTIIMKRRFSFWILIAGLAGAAGVGLSAWSSHGLARLITDPDALQFARERAQTANHYLLIHALALLGTGVWRQHGAGVLANVAGALFTFGLLAFAGGLYLLYIFNDFSGSNTVYLVPLGGSSLIMGWLALAASAWQPARAD